MSSEDQQLFHAIAGNLLDELGYETPDLGRMQLSQAARYFQLQIKYFSIESARRTLQTVGLFHPTSLLAHRLKLKKAKA
jgi:hypothetical protein